MKKFVSFAAFALLATMSLSFVSCSSDDDLPEEPTTAQEAREMLLGQWQRSSAMLAMMEGAEAMDAIFLEFGRDGILRHIMRYKSLKDLPFTEKDLEDEELMARIKRMAGKTFGDPMATFVIEPDPKEPTKGKITTTPIRAMHADPDVVEYLNLTRSSVTLRHTNPRTGRTSLETLTRPAKPVKYEASPDFFIEA